MEELGIALGVPATATVKATSVMVEGPILIRAGAVIMAALLISACGGDGADRASSFPAAPQYH